MDGSIQADPALRIGIVGLGPVGAVSAACLSALGHSVIGLERDPARAERLSEGIGPCAEPGLDDLLARGLASGLFRLGSLDDVAACDLSLVCVGTPVGRDGRVELDALASACEELAAAIARAGDRHVVALRSTVPPGTTAIDMAPRIRQVAERPNLPVAFWPEFMREAVAVRDFMHPSYTVFGVSDPEAESVLRRLIRPIDQSPYCVAPTEAEAVKIVSNAWHATKVAFANEIGRVVETVGADSAEVMELFCKDAELNISSRYLRPGFAYGGSCLPKDLRALCRMGAAAEVATPLLEGAAASNRAHVEHAAARIAATGCARVALLGVAFKPGTDDVRESPSLDLAGALEARGVAVRLHDPLIRLDNLPPSAGCLTRTGQSVFDRLPDLLARDIGEAMRDADMVVVVHNTRAYLDAVEHLPPDRWQLVGGAALSPIPAPMMQSAAAAE